MKSLLAILLLATFLCGCSRKETTSSSPAIDLVQAGTNETWKQSDNTECVLHITKRDGNQLEGVKIITTTPGGQKTTCTAKTGTLKPGSTANSADQNFVTIVVQNPLTQRSDEPKAFKIDGDVTFVLHK